MQLALQPLFDEPALLLKEKKTLIVADLHIGIENELRQNGLQVPSQTKLMEHRLISIVTTHEVDHIILLGDIKHTIPSSTNQERADVKNFLRTIQSYCTLHILPGNHDGNIHRLCSPSIQLHPSNGFVFEGIGLTHGHRKPSAEVMQCEQVVIGHSHPTVMLTDRLGYRTFEQCWLRGPPHQEVLQEKYPASPTSHILLIPAFNMLCGGVAVNRDSLLGPFGSLIDVDKAEVYLLDGSLLGKVKDLKESG
ncbi:MAG: metallophosphoesterase [Candidatus Thermoplasmatota archaeon]|nr:metallophosphoesterase [Candidatus Thermoplasmatota archaeon]